MSLRFYEYFPHFPRGVVRLCFAWSCVVRRAAWMDE